MPVGSSEKGMNGRDTKHLTGKGSKSERQGVFLETDEGSFVLRRGGGHPLFDPVLGNWSERPYTAKVF